MARKLLSALNVGAMITAAACGTASMTSPSAAASMTSLATVGLKSGNSLVSTQSTGGQPGTCGGFSWTITTVTATSVSGNFSTYCYGSILIAGNGSAQATVATDGTISWTGSAMASRPGETAQNCAVSLSGTLTPTATGAKVTYSGSTCYGPVSGTEVLAPK